MDSNRERATKIHMVAPMYGPTQARKTFVLCFDGTGNVFTTSVKIRGFGGAKLAVVEILRDRQRQQHPQDIQNAG